MANTALIEDLLRQYAENPRRVFARLANELRKSGDYDRAIEICRGQIPQQPGYISGHGQGPKEPRTQALAAMTDYRARLRTLFGRYEPSILATRPPSGDWSAIENAGHLLVAMQLHLGP